MPINRIRRGVRRRKYSPAGFEPLPYSDAECRRGIEKVRLAVAQLKQDRAERERLFEETMEVLTMLEAYERSSVVRRLAWALCGRW